VFGITVPASDVAVMIHHTIPKEIRGRAIGWTAVQFVKCRQSDQLRNLSIGMFAGQDVLATRQWIENGLVVKLPRQLQVTLVARIRVEIRKRLIDAAVLTSEHALHLRFGQVGMRCRIPIRQPFLNLQGLRVAAQTIRITQSRQHLVLRVVRHPDAIQVESGRTNVALSHLGVGLPAAGNRGQITIPVGCLAFSQFIHDVVRTLEEPVIARRGIGQRAGGEVVPE